MPAKKRPAARPSTKRPKAKRPARPRTTRSRRKKTSSAPRNILITLLIIGILSFLYYKLNHFITLPDEEDHTVDEISEFMKENPDAEVFQMKEAPIPPPPRQSPPLPPQSRNEPKAPPPPPTVAKTEVPPKTPAPPKPEPKVQVKQAVPIITEPPASDLDFAQWQIQLERRHYSCGTIDGDIGSRSRKALLLFQRGHGLAPTGKPDFETRLQLGKPNQPFTNYTVTAKDLSKIQPPPKLWAEKAQASYLGYYDAWEMLAERFHASPKFLQDLNPGVVIQEGSRITVPNLEPSFPLPQATSIEIRLSETTLIVRTGGRITACFPCSIARNKNKRPKGKLEVVNFALNPNYTFNPKTFPSIAEREGITSKLILSPGPNNPVGLAWIGLSLPGYGIHGTPEPGAISRTQSSGCFRLANWNAVKLAHMVKPGVPVIVKE